HPRAHRHLEDFLRAGAEDDVFGLHLVLLGERLDERGVGRRAVERVAPRFGELAENRVKGRLAGAERILVAADADLLDARWQRWPRRALSTPLRLCEMILKSAGGKEGAVDGPLRSSQPKETAAGYRHGEPSLQPGRILQQFPQFPQRNPVGPPARPGV